MLVITEVSVFLVDSERFVTRRPMRTNCDHPLVKPLSGVIAVQRTVNDRLRVRIPAANHRTL